MGLNNTCVSVSLYNVTYRVMDINTNNFFQCTSLIKADSFDEAKCVLYRNVKDTNYSIEIIKIEPTVFWKEKKEGIPFSDLMTVVCIKEHKNMPNGGKKGEQYFIQRSSIYMGPDGTAYGNLFDDNEGTVFLSHVKLDRFMSV